MRRLVLAVFSLIGLVTLVIAAPADEEPPQATEPLADFVVLDYALPGVITLVKGPAQTITITATERQRDALHVAVADGTLQLSRRPGMGRGLDLEDVIIEVTYQSLNSVAVSGSGQLEAAALDSDGPFKLSVAGSGSMAVDLLRCEAATLLIAGSGTIQLGELVAQRATSEISGSGELTLGGVVGEQSLSIAGSGDYRAAELVTATATVRIVGSGSATLNAAERISGSITGSGDVLYRGTPEIAVGVSGSGDIAALTQAL